MKIFNNENLSETDTESALFANTDVENVVLPSNLIGHEHMLLHIKAKFKTQACFFAFNNILSYIGLHPPRKNAKGCSNPEK